MSLTTTVTPRFALHEGAQLPGLPPLRLPTTLTA